MSALTAYQTALIQYHLPHERWNGLMEVQTEFDTLTFWRLFRTVWDAASVIQPDQEVIRRLLTEERLNSPDRLAAWTIEDRQWMVRAIRRDKPIKVYRGGSRANVTGLSWSADSNVATRYALFSGAEKGTVVVGRVEPRHAILANDITREIVAMPEHIDIERVDEVDTRINEQTRMELMLRSTVAASGANTPAGMTQGGFLANMIAEGKVEKETIVRHMETGLKAIENLGFKARVETIREILKEIN